MTTNKIIDNEMPDSVSESKTARLNHPWLVLVILFIVAFITEQIFFDHKLGLQWPIFIALLLSAVTAIVIIERVKVPVRSLWLFFPILLLTILGLFRSEAFTIAGLGITTVAMLVWLAITFLNGQSLVFRWREHIAQTFMLFLNAVIGLPGMLIDKLRGGEKVTSPSHQAGRGTWLAVLRGLLIALPILAIFAALLASADQVFSRNLKSLFDWMDNFRVEDFLQHLFLIGFITYVLFGIFSFAFTRTRQSQRVEPDQPLIKPFLGLTESNIVLILVNLLFAAFLVIQFRYFFAGQSNISETGFTYAEYAVKGFQELILVAIAALGLHWLLASVTRRETPGQKSCFSLIITLLIVQVSVILVSAFQRLSLYEAAYGFTQSRLVAHVFIVFIGLMLLAALIMQWFSLFKRQALILLSLTMLFAVVLGVINIDVTVTNLNLRKAQADGKLDAGFLIYSMSTDCIPALFKHYDNQALSPALHETIGKVLACQARRLGQPSALVEPWYAISLPQRAAARLFSQRSAELSKYHFETESVREGALESKILIDGEWVYCGPVSPTTD